MPRGSSSEVLALRASNCGFKLRQSYIDLGFPNVLAEHTRGLAHKVLNCRSRLCAKVDDLSTGFPTKSSYPLSRQSN